MYRNILLDFDGTMGDTRETIVNVFHKVIENAGLPQRDQSLISSTIGMSLTKAFVFLFPGMDEKKAEEMTLAYRDVYEKTWRDDLKPMPGLHDTLKELKDKGCRLAVTSSRTTAFIEKLCEQLGVSQYFDLYVGDDMVSNPKPAPDMAIFALQKMGANKGETLLVGDTHYDMAMGHAAGLKTVYARYGYGDEESVKYDYPDYEIDSISGILKIVQ